MKKKSILFILCMASVFSMNAQDFKDSDRMLSDTKYRKGVLKNGLTYYIYPTTVNKNTASYYIIQNVGSILENDQQKGLAHFLEHMAFNGTKHFEGKGILTTLQKHGAIFGDNINAYTSLDETVYNLDNIPTDKKGIIDTCLIVLKDWSHDLLLKDEEIDAERGVITEEWRTRQDARQRIYDQLADSYYNNSLYSKRTPIGDMNIVKNFKYNTLRDFYRDWYRTDLQAIAIVGDINPDEVEQKIIAMFSTIPVVKNPKKRFEVIIPNKAEPVFKLALDKEITASKISYYIRRNGKESNATFHDFKVNKLRDIAFSILNNRLKELTLEQTNPFKNAYIDFSMFVRTSQAFSMSIEPKPNLQAESLTLVLNEFMRAKKFGFSEGEINRAVKQMLNSYENYLEKIDETSHKEVIESVKSNFLENLVITDPKMEFEAVKQILKDLKSQPLQDLMSAVYGNENRLIAVTGVENETNLTKEIVFDLIRKAENNSELKPYEDTFQEKSLMGDVVVNDGKIVSEQYNSEIDATTFVLSNGVKVYYKLASKNKNEIKLRAESYGGTSLYSYKDLPSVSMMPNLVQMSGIGDLSANELKKMMMGNTAQTYADIDNLTESIEGDANTKDIESLFQLTHLRFVKPRFESSMFELLKNNLQNVIINKDKDIKSKMKDSMSIAVYGRINDRVRLMNKEFIDDLSFDKMQLFYNERFQNVANFKFFLVGDIEIAKIRPLLEKYIASIPSTNNTETYSDVMPKWTSNNIDKNIFIPMQTPKSTVNLCYEKEMEFNKKNELLTHIIGNILELRYTESLREKEGGTYGAGVNATLSKLPTSKCRLSIKFDCDAAKVDNLIPIVYKEIENIKKGIIEQGDIDKTKASYIKSKEDNQSFNDYKMNVVYEYFVNNVNIDDPNNFENILSTISKKDIQGFANTFLQNSKSYKIVFKPLL